MAKDAIAAISWALLYQHGVEAHFVALEGVLWARISAHVYNEIGDYARLAEALPGVLAEQPWLAEG